MATLTFGGHQSNNWCARAEAGRRRAEGGLQWVAEGLHGKVGRCDDHECVISYRWRASQLTQSGSPIGSSSGRPPSCSLGLYTACESHVVVLAQAAGRCACVRPRLGLGCACVPHHQHGQRPEYDTFRLIFVIPEELEVAAGES